jgi:hypothetical protein
VFHATAPDEKVSSQDEEWAGEQRERINAVESKSGDAFKGYPHNRENNNEGSESESDSQRHASAKKDKRKNRHYNCKNVHFIL